MWIQIALTLVFISLSHQKCQIKDNVLSSRFMTKSFLSCTDISQYYDLYTDITSKTSVGTIVISESNIPRLDPFLFRNVSFMNMKIEAKVRVIENYTFKLCFILTLTLNNNNIRQIENNTFPPSLQYLDLQNNSLSEIKANYFTGLSDLTELKLNYNKIINIQRRSFDSLTNLKELDLSFNKLKDLPLEVFKTATNLEKIYLNDNLINELRYDVFSNCTKLKYLYIQNNAVTLIDTEYYPISLFYINASRNQITSIEFSNMVNLDTLDLSFNNLTHILGWMYNVPSLKLLYLNYNRLGPFIDIRSFRHLKNLTTMELGHNNLQKINFELFNNLPVLSEISLAGNDLDNILDLNDLNAPLTMLNLNRNFLEEVRNLLKFRDLIYLDLSYNDIQEIKYDTFQNLKNLQILLLQHNSIHTLRLGCFRDLNKLQNLNLAHNNLTSLEPGVFTGFNYLHSLDISHNNLFHLDGSTFNNIKDLKTLNIAYNNLTKVEIQHIFQHSMYAEVDLRGNNWACKALTELFVSYSFISIHHGTSYNVTNVYGIECNNRDMDNDKNANNLVNLTIYLESINEHTKEMSYKMTVNIIVLITVLIFLCVKFTSIKCFSWFTAAQQFFYSRNRNDPEFQLT